MVNNGLINRKKKLCCEDISNIENYDKAVADTTQTWHCHHRLETHFSDGTPRPANARLSKEELIALDMYYNRPAEELIYLTPAEHNIIHRLGFKATLNHKHSEETKHKISEAHKGKKYPKLSEAKMGSTPWNKGISNTKNIGKHWYNNGTVNVYLFECPDGFVKGRLPLKLHKGETNDK